MNCTPIILFTHINTVSYLWAALMYNIDIGICLVSRQYVISTFTGEDKGANYWLFKPLTQSLL